MSITFSGSELINIAIDSERMGVAFYDIMSRSTDNDSARDIFRYLTNMEREHINIFQNMLPEADKFQLTKDYTEDYAYLQALVDNAVFTDEFITSEMANQANSDIKALELGIKAERDSILFYYEMRDLVPSPNQKTIDKIISEEKSHLRQLSALKNDLTIS